MDTNPHADTSAAGTAPAPAAAAAPSRDRLIVARLIDRLPVALKPAARWATDHCRAGSLLILFVVSMLYVLSIVPEKDGPLAYLVARLAIGGYMGYWIDRVLHPYARPRSLRGIERGAAEKRRAMIVAACIVAAGFNL